MALLTDPSLISLMISWTLSARARAHTLTHTHTHTPVAYQGNETEEKVFKKRKVFREDLKELTEVEWRTETGSWFHITGAW